MQNQLNPARDVIALLGGVRSTARILQLSPSAVSRWTVGTEKRGTGGRIPQRYWALLIAHAKKERIKVTLKELARIDH